MKGTALAVLNFEDDEEDHLTTLEFGRIARLVESKAGIKLPPNKRLMLEGRLRKRLRAHGLETFKEYCEFLFKGEGTAGEIGFLINVVTTNKTDFFREPDHFDFLMKKAVPELIRRRSGTETQPLLKVWSAASSTGAEAYTLAMVLHNRMVERRDIRCAILGTDISTTVLEQGERAVYPTEMMSPVPEPFLSRYVMWPRNSGGRTDVRIVPELRRMVRFAHLNLMDDTYPFDRDVDVIFLRNVLIYFEKADQEAVVRRLAEHLRPGGYLFLGHSESMIGNAAPVRQVAPAVFQKP